MRADKFFLFFLVILVLSLLVRKGVTPIGRNLSESDTIIWEVKSIDSMKYSRDLTREKLNDLSFEIIIDRQVKDIAETHATHIAVGTPYDEEFIPYLKRWVEVSRKYNLKVWFRGNFSGWEGWFGYKRIDRKTHIRKIRDFIKKNSELFEDGDIFTSCTECENGGPGDPRRTGDVAGFRKFLVDEYEETKKEFSKIGKNIRSNYFSMNGDVAKLIMDKDTTKALDGIVVIDHYVATPEILVNDIKEIAQRSGGKIVLGEFGVPIPDIHGSLTEEEQKIWLESALSKLYGMPELIGLNYWVNVGGTTALWYENGNPKMGVDVIRSYYSR